jgi:hypothetical protein
VGFHDLNMNLVCFIIVMTVVTPSLVLSMIDLGFSTDEWGRVIATIVRVLF